MLIGEGDYQIFPLALSKSYLHSTCTEALSGPGSHHNRCSPLFLDGKQDKDRRHLQVIFLPRIHRVLYQEWLLKTLRNAELVEQASFGFKLSAPTEREVYYSPDVSSTDIVLRGPRMQNVALNCRQYCKPLEGSSVKRPNKVLKTFAGVIVIGCINESICERVFNP